MSRLSNQKIKMLRDINGGKVMTHDLGRFKWQGQKPARGEASTARALYLAGLIAPRFSMRGEYMEVTPTGKNELTYHRFIEV